MVERDSAVDVFDRPVLVDVVQAGNFDVLLVSGCDAYFADSLALQFSTAGSNWVKELQVSHSSRSRRKIAFCTIGDERIVIKQKTKVNDKPEFPGLPIGYFTYSFLHEIRASIALHQVLTSDANVPRCLTYNDTTYQVLYRTQQPLAAVINRENPAERYTVFKYIVGESARDVTDRADGWNYLEQSLRTLFGRMHVLLNQIALLLLTYEIEPWDLGVHQVIYQIDEVASEILMGIIDTEEYNFSDKYGNYWPESYSKIGLPPVLVEIGMFGS